MIICVLPADNYLEIRKNMSLAQKYWQCVCREDSFHPNNVRKCERCGLAKRKPNQRLIKGMTVHTAINSKNIYITHD